MRERKSNELDHVRCRKSDHQRILVQDNNIRESGENKEQATSIVTTTAKSVRMLIRFLVP